MFDGEDDSPLANMLGTTTKYSLVSSASPSPIIHSRSAWVPVNQLGKTMTLSRASLSAP